MGKKYTNLAGVLKKLLFERNMRPIDLARNVKIPPPTIHRLITGKSTRPYKSSLKPIADYFAISVEELIGEKSIYSIPKQTPSTKRPSGQIIMIPLISWRDITNLVQAKENASREIAISGIANENAFALIMPDSSMEPLFPYGSILIFNPEYRVKDRSYVLVKFSDRNLPVFRQLVLDFEHKFIKPLNQDLAQFGMRLIGDNDKIIGSLYESRLNSQILDDEDLVKELIHVD